jgi:ribosomal protein S18 acetylase RimI-like enzyme
MSYPIRSMSLDDYERVYHLWSTSEGMSLDEDDSRDGIASYLRRNPGLCFVALDGKEIVGAVLCGHEGRRGILRHLAVSPDYRKKGIATSLIRACFGALSADGIKKCNIFVMDDNGAGLKFWEYIGFYRLDDNYRTLQHLTQTQLRSSRP